VHCDLKPENILLESKDSNRIKIIDLGLSQIVSKKNNLKTERGSIYYLAPEMIRKDYDHKVDIWSAGVIFYILVTGVPPFNAMVEGPNGNMGIDSKKIKEKILKGKTSFKAKLFKNFDPEVKEIIQAMLTYDPKERPDAKEILQYAWFKKKISKKKKEEGIR
jgi:calcium-dependent protein kinase